MAVAVPARVILLSYEARNRGTRGSERALGGTRAGGFHHEAMVCLLPARNMDLWVNLPLLTALRCRSGHVGVGTGRDR